jgi:hypothetical protein
MWLSHTIQIVAVSRGTSQSASWIPIAVATVSAIGAIAAAIVAAISARRTKQAELQADRILELEKRLAESRAKIFEPMVEAIGRLWEHIAASGPLDAATMKKVALDDIVRFTHWVQIYGSDDSVEAALHFMQASYHEPPPSVITRLLAEMVLATRRELGYPETTVTALEILAMRITDAYTDPSHRADMSDPLNTVFDRYNWQPPWAPIKPLAEGD